MLIMVDIDSTLYEANALSLECSRELGLPEWPIAAHWNVSADFGYDPGMWDVLFSRAHDEDRIFQTVPYWGSVDALCDASQRGHDIWYVSNRKPESYEATIGWLMRWGFPTPENLWAEKGDKFAEWIKVERPEIVIEDRVKTILASAELGCEVLVIEHPHNVNLYDTGIQQIHMCKNWIKVREYLEVFAPQVVFA